MGKTNPGASFMRSKKNKKGKQSVAKVDSKLNKVISKLNEAIELKCLDSAAVENVTIANNTNYYLSPIQRGQTVATRVGDQVRAKSLWIRYHAYEDDSSVTFRVVIFRLKSVDQSTSTLNAQTLWNDSTPHAGTAMYNYTGITSTDSNIENLVVLYDKTHVGGTNVMGNSFQINGSPNKYCIKIPLNCTMSYRYGTGTTMAYQSENLLFMNILVQDGVTIDQFNYNCQLYFTDL